MPEKTRGAAGDPTTILVVCTGNICRSPMAAGFIEHHLRLAGLTDRAVQSRGTHALEGHRAVKESIAGAAARGVDISHHRALPFTLSDVEWADVILVMEHYHVESIGQQFGPRARDKVQLLGKYAGVAEIEDPFGGDAERFDRVAEQIWQATLRFVQSFARRKS
jgi:protein-tyrosine phosphatase